jgi:hypothetical protein
MSPTPPPVVPLTWQWRQDHLAAGDKALAHAERAMGTTHGDDAALWVKIAHAHYRAAELEKRN